MPSETIRIHPETHAKLRDLAERCGRSTPQVLADAVEFYRRQKFLEDANRAYATLRQDVKACAAEQTERAAWDNTLSDGLKDG